MTPVEVLNELRAAGVVPYFDGGRLRGRAPAGAYSDQLRALVDEHRPDLVAHLQAQRARVDAALDALQRAAGGQAGRLVVVGTYRALAARWRDEGNPKLHELPEAAEALAERWRQEDTEARGTIGG